MSGRYYYIEIDDTSANMTVTCKNEVMTTFEDGAPVDVGSSIPYGRHRKLRVYLPYGCEYVVNSSSDEISVKVYEPSIIGYRDCDVEINNADGTYTLGISKTNK